jgi:hypothetical protein
VEGNHDNKIDQETFTTQDTTGTEDKQHNL